MKTTIWLLVCSLAAAASAAEPKVTLAPIDGLLSEPFGVDFDRSGVMYVIEYGSHRLIRVKDRQPEAIAGNGQKGSGGDGGPANAAQLNSPHSIAIAQSGDIFIADSFNCRVRKIDAKTGMITTFTGTGEKGFGGDGGPANKAEFGNIYCV